MTTLRDLAIDGPALHAFVIGVGQYDWFKGGTHQRPRARRDDHCRGFAQLTAPPVSATAMCEALLGPLGSLEVLISAEDPVRLAGDEGSTEIAPAMMRGVRAAFERWYERCDGHADNVALFHFCGHGVQVGRGPHGLLLQDTGESLFSYFENAVDLDRTVLGMEDNTAEKQLFFVDACRGMPSSLEEAAGIDATALKSPVRDPQSRDRLIGSTWWSSRVRVAFRGHLRRRRRCRWGFVYVLRVAGTGAAFMTSWTRLGRSLGDRPLARWRSRAARRWAGEMSSSSSLRTCSPSWLRKTLGGRWLHPATYSPRRSLAETVSGAGALAAPEGVLPRSKVLDPRSGR